MLVKEKFNNIFTEIKNTKKLSIFDFIESNKLDTLYIIKYGNRELKTGIGVIENEVLINVIVDVYGKKWDDLLLTYTNSIEDLKTYSELITETISDDGSINLTRENINKVSAFNVDEFVNNSNDDNVESNTSKHLKERQYEIKKLKNVKMYDDMISYLNRINICDIMFTDINNLVTLKIFK